MPIPEPLLHNEDTQPTAADLRPTAPRKMPKHALPTPLLVLLILTSIISLSATLIWLLQNQAPPTVVVPRTITIHLQLAGEYRELESAASTVAELLEEQGIQLAPDDALSLPLESPLSANMNITIDHARTIQLIMDAQVQTLRSPFENPAQILASQGIVLEDTDSIWLDGTLAEAALLANWTVPVNEIRIERAVMVTIYDGADEIPLRTRADTVGDALYEAEIVLYVTDLVQPDLSTPLENGMTIRIDRALPVLIHADGTSIESRVQGQTVLDALSEAGISLFGLDYVMPSETSPIEAYMDIRVLRVTEQLLSADETLPYETVFQADAALELDQTRVLQAGQTGIRRHEERVRYENGIEIGREPAGSSVIRAPQNEIIGYGTQIVLRTIETPEGVREYWRKLRVYATSYHPEAVNGSTTTAIGMTLRKGVFSADPTIIPYRTEAYIPNYGLGIMGDTGGARSSRYWIDLGYSDEDWVSWHHYVDIYLLTPVPANINYRLPSWSAMRGLPDNG